MVAEVVIEPVVPDTRRHRLRIQTVEDIKAVAIRLVDRDGASALSMREVARELSTAPSALYRYFDGRDALLSALIADSFDQLGSAAEAAIASQSGMDPHGAWLAAARAVRAWGLANPSRWGLIYGTPIAGYAVDEDITQQPAMRLTNALTQILNAARTNGRIDRGKMRISTDRLSRAAHESVEQAMVNLGVELPVGLFAEGIAAWSQLIGIVTFEVFNHLAPLTSDPEPLFESHIQRIGAAFPFKPASAGPTTAASAS